MKLQFSLATLLICMTVLAVVCAISIKIPAINMVIDPDPFSSGFVPFSRPPTLSEIAIRLAVWGPTTIAATLGVLWTFRRLKSRPH